MSGVRKYNLTPHVKNTDTAPHQVPPSGAGNAAMMESTGTGSTTQGWADETAEAIWDWLFGDDEEQDHGELPTCPGSDRDGPGDDGSCEEADAPYLDQRDNPDERVWDDDEAGRDVEGNQQCTPTSTAMAILGLIGEDAFRSRAEALFGDRGQPMEPGWFLTSAPEHIVWTYIYLRTFDEWAAEVGVDEMSIEPHESGMVMQIVLEEFSQADGTFDQRARLGEATHQQALESVATLPAVIGTQATAAGHTMTLLGVFGSGALVHDPYGSNRGKAGDYLENGNEPTPSIDPTVPHRWDYNPALAAAAREGEARSDWGSYNFFSWDEVETLGIGKWVASLDTAASAEQASA